MKTKQIVLKGIEIEYLQELLENLKEDCFQTKCNVCKRTLEDLQKQVRKQYNKEFD
jgi:heterodisulfide reductase subunit B